MEESKSPAKVGKLSQARGTKPSPKEKSNKEAHAQREETASRRAGNLDAATEEHNPGSNGAAKTRGRTSRPARLTGRTSLGESGRGKAAGAHQQPVPEAPGSRGSHSTDSSPSATRESSSPVLAGTAEKGRGRGPAGFGPAKRRPSSVCRAEIRPAPLLR